MKPIPFKAALFDLDGTLLDSMYVWKRVDEIFFGRRGKAVPPDYSREVAGMSYRETAEYTVAKYLPGERWQALIEEWTRLSEIEYAENVPLKSGALGYLRMLKRAGIKLAVVTAMTPNLFTPCLRRLGVLELFDELCSTEHTGGRGKAGGEVYRLAAERLGEAPRDCVVFEDVLSGIAGAKKADMRAYCVRDAHASKDFEAIAAIADGMLDTLEDMRAVHDFEDENRCVVFTARFEGDLQSAYAPDPKDCVLCADGGWTYARALGVTPDRVIGDFDSSEAPETGVVERHPVMKDDTDTMLCVKQGLRMGYDTFLLLGGFGGRFDHTLANLQTLAYAAEHGARAEMRDGFCRAMVLKNGSVRIPRRKGKLSLFALSDRCAGITSRGTAYDLTDAELTNTFPLGVSNEYAADAAEISVKEGTLLIVQTDD